MTDPKRAGDSGADQGADGLDIAIGWLQKNLDELTENTRRIRDLSGQPARSTTAQQTKPQSDAPEPPVEPVKPAESAPSTSTTPLLDSIGRDLTQLARQGMLAPCLDREQETAWVIETLLRSTKRSPILLGPTGVGKTTIVEGLAQRIAAGKVPDALKDARIIEVPLGGLVAGTEYRGQLEGRINQLVAEASRPGIILFLDEIHLLESAGQTQGGVGAAELLKPALTRGQLAVIGATTGDDYRTTIGRDDSVARRFSTLDVAELDKDATRDILKSVRDRIAATRKVTVSDDALDVLLDFADRQIANRRFPDKAIDLLEQAVARALVDGKSEVSVADATATTVEWAKRVSSTPTLERFGRDLIALAKQGKLGPIVGREREIGAIIEILLRKTKRDPLLLGPAGAGKTAIVEGFAIRVGSGNVPDQLKDVRIFDVSLLPLAEAMAQDATLLRDFLAEATHPSVIVFFDEIHLLATAAVTNLAQALKPALARGEIACIGATTGEEYQANLESDAALARRFTQIAIEPMDQATVRQVLSAVRDSLAKSRGVAMGDDVLDEAIALADQFLPNRSFPDKGVDIIEQSIAHALAQGQKSVDVAAMRAAVESLVGMPLDPTARLAALTADLTRTPTLDDASSHALLERLGVSLRGLDTDYRHPDATLLLLGGAAAGVDALAAMLARDLFGRANALIDLDLAGLTEEYSISTLLGSAPGLVGSDRALPLHALRRAPWQVIVFRGIDRCAATVRDVIAQALASGSFTDSMGRTLPLGAAVVVATAPAIDEPKLAEPLLGRELVAACDVITAAVASAAPGSRDAWLKTEVLDPLAARFGRQGYAVTFDADFVAWLTKSLPADGTQVADFIDRSVTPDLAAALPMDRGPLTATIKDDKPNFAPAKS